jgi:hypothetical protein
MARRIRSPYLSTAATSAAITMGKISGFRTLPREVAGVEQLTPSDRGDGPVVVLARSR